jgi:hypothetical protein
MIFVLENVDKGPICTIELDASKVQQFTDAIENSYWFELFIGMRISTEFDVTVCGFFCFGLFLTFFVCIYLVFCLMWSNCIDDLPLWGRYLQS